MTQLAVDKRTILVVGEDVESASLIRTTIERDGYRVVGAITLQAVERAARRDRPILVVITSPLPGCDEIESATAVRSVVRRSDAAILLVATSEDTDFINRAYRAGVSDLLFRPLNAALLRYRAHFCIRAVSLMHELRISESRNRAFITERDTALANERSDTDTLTGLKNRQYVLDVLSGSLETAEEQNQSLAILCVDLDNFKRFNDSLGHKIADGLLKEMADRLKDCVRRDDIVARCKPGDLGEVVARVGDDEFMVIVNDTSGLGDAAAIGDRILAALSQPLIHDDCELVITASIGSTTYPYDGRNCESLVKNADVAMNQAKASGGNTHRAFCGTMSVRSLEHLEIEHALRRAIANDDLELHYQPKLDLDSSEIVGVEALLRWNHPERGTIQPGMFVPLAEKTGMIVQLSQWALHTACNQIRNWQAGPVGEIQIAVNLSGHQFYDDDVYGLITRLLRETSIKPSLLELELTETMLMDSVSDTVNTLHRIKETGVSLAIDDFGTGYSSLSYLRSFPIDTLKIDRTFVAELEFGKDDASICQAIIALGHTLGLKVIAEGVEKAEQLALLKEYGCDEIQGFFFARPQSAADVSEFILSHRSGDPNDAALEKKERYA